MADGGIGKYTRGRLIKLIEAVIARISGTSGTAIVRSNPRTITVDSTIPDGHEAEMRGIITIAAGKTLSIEGDTVLEIRDVS